MSLFVLMFVLTYTHSITIGPTKVTWFEANEWCHQQQSSFELISIHSEIQYNATISAINQIDPDKDNNYWTGLQHDGTDLSNMNSFNWSDGSPFDYGTNFGHFPWRENEPNFVTTLGCVRFTNTYNYLWDDVNCNSTLNGLTAVPICTETTVSPSNSPTKFPTNIPTETPTIQPSLSPITDTPTMTPTTENAKSVDTPITTLKPIDQTNDAQDESKINLTTIIIICALLAICYIIIIGIVLLKYTTNKRMNREHESTKVDIEINISNLRMKHVQTQSQTNTALKELIDDNRKVTAGLTDDEYDGIIDGIIDAHSHKDDDMGLHGEEDHEMENEMQYKTPDDNLENDEFEIVDENDKEFVTPKNTIDAEFS